MDRIRELSKEAKRMTVSAFIEDGYDETVFIKGIENLHPHVRVTYRPLPITERTALSDALAKSVNRGVAREEDKVAAKVLSERIVSLEILNDDGSLVQRLTGISAEQLLKLRSALWLKMTAMLLWGSIPFDHDPFTGVQGGKSGNEQLEADQKN